MQSTELCSVFGDFWCARITNEVLRITCWTVMSLADKDRRGGAPPPGAYHPVDSTDRDPEPSLYSSVEGGGDHEVAIPSSEYAKIQEVEEGGSDRPAKAFSLCEIPREKKILLLMMAVCNFCAAANFSILGPFFPGEVYNFFSLWKQSKEKHLRQKIYEH